MSRDGQPGGARLPTPASVTTAAAPPASADTPAPGPSGPPANGYPGDRPWRDEPGAGGGGWGGGRRRSAYATRDLTIGSVPRTLWFLAWPQYVEGCLRIVDQVADLVWAGLFGGFRAIAGIGAAQQYLGIGFDLRMGLDMSMRAMVSRAIGMGDSSLANLVVFQAATLTLIYSALMVGIGMFLTEALLHLIGLSPETVDLAAAYMRVQLVGQASIGFQMLAGHALAAAGDTITPMKAGFIARLLKIGLSPTLMFGLLGFPSIGLAGAAWATLIGHFVSLIYLLWVLFRGGSRLHLNLHEYRVDAEIQKRLLKVGWPASINGLERTIAQLSFGFLVAPFGDVAYAAFTVTRRVEMFAHQGSQGIGNAAGTLVGQSIGAGKPERAKQAVFWAAFFGFLINGTLAILMALFPNAFLGLFAREPQFLEAARGWLYIMLAGYAVLGLSTAMAQSFQQAGAPHIVMLVNLGTLWGCVPLAFLLSKGTPLAELGVAWAMLVPMLVRPLVFIPYFFSNHWLRIRLFSSEPHAFADEVDP